MFFVDLLLPRHDLAEQLGEMRIWLDRHNVETSGFLLKGAVARLAFRVKPQAEAFAVRFAGGVIAAPPIRHRRLDAAPGPRRPGDDEADTPWARAAIRAEISRRFGRPERNGSGALSGEEQRRLR